jgi:ferric-dicitrate binding protein FerR (iron transport regulator)
MDDSAERELLDLLGAAWDDRLDDAARDRLESLLSRHDFADVRVLVDFTRMHMDLELLVSSSAAHRKALDAIARSKTTSSSAKRRRRPKLAVFLAAASILVAVAIGVQIPWRGIATGERTIRESSSPRASRGGSAAGQLTSLTPNGRWSFGRRSDRDTPNIFLGDTLSIDAGSVALRLSNNVVARMKAPVVLRLDSLEHVRLLHGRMHVDVPEGAEGFSVETANAEVLDLGTSFSVATVDGGTDLIVHQGQVDLKVAGAAVKDHEAGGVVKRLRGGEAVRVDVDRTLSRIVNVRAVDMQRSDETQIDDSLIASVSDNVVRAEMWSFYEIVPGGLTEDAKAFVDRLHEWNGATADGLPSYLVGADYVKTFNDDKISSDLQIQLELKSPAEVYVLLDKRLTPPPWLVERFSDTGDVVGIDEAHGEQSLIAVGPGNSIDQTLSVWKFVADSGGVVPLGPNGDPPPHDHSEIIYVPSNMYGVAVVAYVRDAQ